MSAACPGCGTVAAPDARFCAQCGTRLPAADATGPPAEGEMRHVSVVFCDLVDSTGLAAALDPEDVRTVLSGYYEVARQVAGRHGGVVEKYVGDAVLAVWGAPTAGEDDAERAVRAALALVVAVEAYGVATGHSLRARVGVATGRVAAVRRPFEGLVVGDRVNVAARIQALAPPGAVLVDDATRLAVRAALALSDAGTHAVKGLARPVRLWRVLAPTADPTGAGGRPRPPLVGRDGELAVLTGEFARFLDERRTRLLVLTGQPGVGTTALLREFRKVLDGGPAPVLWHTGHCLARGDGIGFAPLAEMFRARLGVGRGLPPEPALRQLRAGLERWVPDPAVRGRLEPRIAALLDGSEVRLPPQELTAGWRLLLEQLGAAGSVVLSVENAQWAAPDLRAFVEQLLDGAVATPLFVVVSGRPELLAGWPGLGGRRRARTVALEPLSSGDAGRLLDGLSPGLPVDLRRRLVDRADGVPLYLVEFVRSMGDHGPAPGDAAGSGGPGLPPTLTALLQARLDALPEPQRALARDLSVLDGSFTPETAAAVAGVPAAERIAHELGALVDAGVLVAREQAGAGSRGYGFAQTLLRSVAYESLPKRERKRRHLRAARHVGHAAGAAVHYHEAWRCVPTDPDAEALRDLAAEGFAEVGDRARAVGAPSSAAEAYRAAAGLVRDERRATELLTAAAGMLERAGRGPEALRLYDDLVERHRRAGRSEEIPRLAAPAARLLLNLGRVDEARRRLDDAPAIADRADPAAAVRSLERARVAVVSADRPVADVLSERALREATAAGESALLAEAVSLRADALLLLDRPQEALAAYERARRLLADGDPDERLRVLFRSGYAMLGSDLPESRAALEAALAAARDLGNVPGRQVTAGLLAQLDVWTGHWAAAEARLAAELASLTAESRESGLLRVVLAEKLVLSGAIDAARQQVAQAGALAGSGSGQFRATYEAVSALVLAESDLTGAASRWALIARLLIPRLGLHAEPVRHVWPHAVDAALRLDRLEEADSLLTLVVDAPGAVPPFLRAQRLRFGARVRAARGNRAGVVADLRAATGELDRLGYPYWRALAQADLAAELRRQGRADEAERHHGAATRTLALLRADTPPRAGGGSRTPTPEGTRS